ETDDGWQAARLTTNFGAAVSRHPQLHVYRYRLRQGVSVQAAITQLRKRRDVLYAEPNHILHAFATPNDTFYATKQYGPQKVQADLAWGIWQPSAQVILAIVDTGIDNTHPDLTNKILRDVNGNVIGYNALTGVAGPASDDYGHGTHCAGIAAAQINNVTGVA